MKRIFLSNLHFGLLFLFSLALIVHYRNGLGDIDLYAQAGKKILAGENPYVKSEYANSPLGGVAIYAFSLFIPKSAFPTVVLLLNILGLISFIKTVTKNVPIFNVYLAIIALSISIPFRALISNVQVTGIVLGLLSLAITLANKKTSATVLLGYIIMGCALELKPQVSLPFVFVLVYKNWNLSILLKTIGFYALLHFIVSIRFGSFIEILWLEKLSQFSEKSFLPGYEISIWKFFVTLSNQITYIQALSTLALVLYFITLIKMRNRSTQSLLLIATLAPLVGSYSHMYDLVPIILMISLIPEISLYFKVVILSALILPSQLDLYLIVCFVFLCCVLLGIYRFIRKDFLLAEPLSFALYSSATVIIANWFSEGDIELELSTRLALLIPIGLLQLKKYGQIRRQSARLSAEINPR